MKKDIKIANNYDEMLISILPDLNKFSYLQGTEGKVFFVDDYFVVKKYFSTEEDVSLFYKFCEEIKGFSDRGYSVPKIYSWLAIPDGYGGSNLVILEERINGTMLFDADMSSMFEKCKSFCSRDEFNASLENEKQFQELFCQIAREYIKTYLATNESLLNISDEEIENLIKSEHGMFTNSNYSIPDVQACNIIFDGKKLTLIDNGFVGHGLFFKDSPKQINQIVLRDMFYIFYENLNVRALKTYSPVYTQEIEQLKKKNAEVCFENMRRFVKSAKSILGYNQLDGYDYCSCLSISEDVLGEKLANELCEEIEREK